MQDKFGAKLQASFDDADASRSKIEMFKKLAKQDPAATAAAVCELIPYHMRRVRTQAREAYGVDIAREGWEEQFKKHQRPSAAEAGLAEAGLLLIRANLHLVFSWCQAKLAAIAADRSLSDEEQAAKVCEVGVEAVRGVEQVYLHNLQELRYQTSGEAEKIAKDELATRLAGDLVTQISVTRNKRLAKALDGVREHNKPASRERFETLLRELYALAPEAWADLHAIDWQLKTTRSAVLKKIEQPQTPHVEEGELAMFTHAEREALLLKRGRDARLPPSEYELLKLLAAKPKIPNREAADKLGKSVGTVKKLKHNIKKTLGAA
jgi:DNA-binding CsgD family transcriptional regulator